MWIPDERSSHFGTASSSAERYFLALEKKVHTLLLLPAWTRFLNFLDNSPSPSSLFLCSFFSLFSFSFSTPSPLREET